MLQMEETRLSKQVKPSPRHHDNSSSSTVLYAGADGNSRPSNNNNNNHHNSGRGNRGRHRGNGRSRGRGRYNNNWQQNPYGSPWYYNQQPHAYAPIPPHYAYPPPGYAPYSPGPLQQYQHQPGTPAHQGILGSHPSPPNQQAHMAQLTTTPQLTQLPPGLTHAFNTMTLQEPDNAWYMDSGASTHITSNAGNLQSLFYSDKT